MAWSVLMRRVFEVDVLVCAECEGRCRVLCAIDGASQPEVVARVAAAWEGRQRVRGSPSRC